MTYKEMLANIIDATDNFKIIDGEYMVDNKADVTLAVDILSQKYLNVNGKNLDYKNNKPDGINYLITYSDPIEEINEDLQMNKETEYVIKPTYRSKGVTKEDVEKYAELIGLDYDTALRRWRMIQAPESNYERVLDRLEPIKEDANKKYYIKLFYNWKKDPDKIEYFDNIKDAKAYGNKKAKESAYISKVELGETDNMHVIDTLTLLSGEEEFNEAIEKHDELNPKLWDGDKLKPEVEAKLREIVQKFDDNLKDNDVKLDVKDICIIGSNANYNYSPDSDIDLHIIADTSAYPNQEELAMKVYLAYKSLFNNKYDPMINGIEVEIYVEPDAVQANSNGIYSLDNGWLKAPEQVDVPDIDPEHVQELVQPYEDRYNEIVNGDPTIEDVDQLIDDIYLQRQQSIAKDGEFSDGNICFKEFRNRGYLQNLRDLKVELENKEMSLNTFNEGVLKTFFNTDEEDLYEDLDIKAGQIYENDPEHTIEILSVDGSNVTYKEKSGFDEYEDTEYAPRLKAMLTEYNYKLAESLNEDADEEIDFLTDRTQEQIIYKHLQENGIYPDSVDVNGDEAAVVLYGDWRHEHQRCDKLMLEINYDKIGSEDVDDDPDDVGTLIHHYKFNNDPNRQIKEEVTEMDNGIEFSFPNVEDTLAVYLQWEGIYGYDYGIIDAYEEGGYDGLSDYLDEEGIYGYTETIRGILDGESAWLSRADMDDFRDLCRDQGLMPETAINESLNENKIINTDVTPDMIANSNYVCVYPTEKGIDELGSNPDDTFEYERFEDGWHTLIDGKDAELTPLSDDDLYHAISNLNGEGNFEYEFNESLNEAKKVGLVSAAKWTLIKANERLKDKSPEEVYNRALEIAGRSEYPFVKNNLEAKKDEAIEFIKVIREAEWNPDLDESLNEGNNDRLKEILSIPEVKEYVDFQIDNAEYDDYTGDYDYVDITYDTDFDEIADANGISDEDRKLLYDYMQERVYNESLNEGIYSNDEDKIEVISDNGDIVKYRYIDDFNEEPKELPKDEFDDLIYSNNFKLEEAKFVNDKGETYEKQDLIGDKDTGNRAIEPGINWVWFWTDNRRDAIRWFKQLTGELPYEDTLVKRDPEKLKAQFKVSDIDDPENNFIVSGDDFKTIDDVKAKYVNSNVEQINQETYDDKVWGFRLHRNLIDNMGDIVDDMGKYLPDEDFELPEDLDEELDNLSFESLDTAKLKEDTVKQNGKWVNNGDEGTHGKFKTKKEADAQRKAMFANGYKA